MRSGMSSASVGISSNSGVLGPGTPVVCLLQGLGRVTQWLVIEHWLQGFPVLPPIKVSVRFSPTTLAATDK